MDLGNILNFFSDDWKKIPQNLRWFIWFGTFLIFNSWLLDHWGTKNTNPYLILGFIDIRTFGYNIGFFLITFIFIVLLVKQYSYFRLVKRYRNRYSIDTLNEKFYLIWFQNGKLFVLDNFDNNFGQKEAHHVFPYETAEDLFFAGTGVLVSPKFEDSPVVQINSNIQIDTGKWIEGRPINTRVG